jgi:transposase
MRRREIASSALPVIESTLAKEKDGRVVKWLLAIRLICLKKSTGEVRKAIAVSAAQVRRWINRFHHGGIEAMRPCWSSGQTSKLTAEQMDRVRKRVGRPNTSGCICLARPVPQPETRTAAFFQRQTVTPWSSIWPVFRVTSMTMSMPCWCSTERDGTRAGDCKYRIQLK